ncbi:FHA domain-containing protein [Streptomyces winkii]|uniref:FHA domain-containing protein n=1 Tax=Streptomyces winkii TaxID=3051178 RepID=UPI0028D6D110|nr:FHA domain-containing protein [Streptomyces sp. DSM 40971]
MTSLEFGANPPRVSDADRERALEVLREGAAEGRISQNTFESRMGVILNAQWHGELQAVLDDLPSRRPRSRWLAETIARVLSFPRALRNAWQSERLPELLLPAPGAHAYSIGRAPGSMLRLNHFTVSRTHAQLRSTGDGWKLRDLGSSNGTWVNGSRVTGSVRVRPGDVVRFGQIGFKLALTRPPSPQPPAHP